MSRIKAHKPASNNHHSNKHQSFVQQTALTAGQKSAGKDNQSESEATSDVQTLLQPKTAPFGGEPFVRQTVFGQAKLNIGKPNDKYEVEADRVADQVVAKSQTETPKASAPPPPVQKKDAGGPKESDGVKEEEVQMKSAPEKETEIQEKPISESISTGIQLKPIAQSDDSEVQKMEAEPEGEGELQTKLDSSTEAPETIQKAEMPAEESEVQKMASEPEEKIQQKSEESETELQTKLDSSTEGTENLQKAEAPAEESEVQKTPIQTKCASCGKEESSEKLNVQQKCASCESDEAPIQKKESDSEGEAEVQTMLDASTEQATSIQKVEAEETDIQKAAAPSAEEAFPLTMGAGASGGEEKKVQKKTDSTAQNAGNSVESSLQSSKGGGQQMDSTTRSSMESGFGSDFSNVKIHTDSKAVQMNKDLGAKAFTNGSDIYFNQGQYNPSSKDGQHLLAHELTHTVQQGASGKAVQKKPDDHKVDSDGANVAARTKKDAEEESGEDINFNKKASAEEKAEARGEVDHSKKAGQKSRITAKGIAKPDVDRPAKERPKVETAAAEGKENLEKDPKQKGKEEKQDEKPRADITAVEEKELSAVQALQKAETIKRPKKPKPLVAPRIEKAKDKTGELIPGDEALDQNVNALHEIAKLFVENSGELHNEAYKDKKEGLKMRAKLEESKGKTESVKAGSKLAKEDKAAREEVDATVEKSHTKNVENVEMVKAEAPKLKSKADEGNEEGGPMVKEAKAKKEEMKAEETEESGADEKQQQKETGEVADGSLTMDQAFTDTGARSEQYLQDALAGEEKNNKARANLDENKVTLEATQAEITRIDEHNAQSEAEIAALDTYPEQVEQETLGRAQSADELYTAAVVMNDQLIDIQEEYYTNMSQVPGAEEAQKLLDEQNPEQEAPAEKAQTPASPEEELLLSLGTMEEDELNATLATFSEEELASLETTLQGMETSEEQPEAAEDPAGITTGEDGRKKFDLSTAMFGKNDEESPPDPRAQWYQPIEERRALRIGEVKKVSDTNFTFLSKEQKQMLAQKLAMTDAVTGLFDIDILDMGKEMLLGMINPVAALKGVMDGANKMISGVVNLFNAEAWAKDPLGNLLQSASDIATGLTMIFGSITGLATVITILMGVLTIASFGFMAWLTGPVISFMATVITTVGGWTIVTGLIALALNSLTYIKNLNDAGNAQNTDELLAESTALKENMTDAAGNLMAVVGAKGDVAGAKMMKNNILKAGGGKNMFKQKGLDFKQSLKQAPGKIGKFVKGAPGKLKKLTTGGVQKLKKGIKNSIEKVKSKFKKTDTPDANKLDIPDNVKALKNDLPTTKGGLKTPKKGGDFGSVDGKKVKGEMDFPDGHKAKVLEDGQCAICTNCELIKKKFDPEIKNPKNKEIVDELGELEKRIETKNKANQPPDAVDVARQKEIHDTLLDQKVKRVKTEYEAKVNDGSFDEARIRQELEAGKEFNPDTKRFGNPDGPKKVEVDPELRKKTQEKVTKKGESTTPKDGSTEMKSASKNKGDAQKKMKEAEDNALNDPEFDTKKAESFEKRHPEAEHKKAFDKEYDDLRGGPKDTPEYKAKKQKAFDEDRKMKREEHSVKYDQGAKNAAKGDAFEDARVEQLNAEGGNFVKRTPDDKITFKYEGKDVVVSPDLQDLTPPGGFREMKSGKLSLTPEVEDQIMRYAQLSQVKNGMKITYELLDGASSSVIEALEKYGIDYIDYSKIK